MYFSIKQIAVKLSVSYWTVRRWVITGKLKGIKLDGIWRVEETELNKFLGKEE